MRSLTGLTFVLAGGAAALIGYYPATADRESALRDLSTWATSGLTAPAAPVETSAQGATADNLAVVDPQRRMFSPQSPLFQTVPAPQFDATPQGKTAGGNAGGVVGDVKPSPVRTVGNPPAETAAVTAPVTSPVATELKLVPKSIDGPTSPARAFASTKAGSEDSKRELTSSLQTELKRVGCYDGEVNGSWNAATKRAMKSFTDRVNATLPVEDPDYILLTLVQGHAGEACGRSCPADQGLSADGRCMPKAIIAQAAKKAARTETAKADRAKPATDKLKTAEIKPSKAESKPETKSATQEKSNGGAVAGSSKGGDWQTTTTATATAGVVGTVGLIAASESAGSSSTGKGGVVATSPKTVTTAAAASATVPSAALPPTAKPVEPLPGRMSVGGPVAPAAVAASNASNAVPVETQTSEPPSPLAKSNGYSTNGSNGNSKPSAEPAAEPRTAPRKYVERPQPRPQRYVPPYNVGAVYAPKPAKTPKAVRIRSMHYNLFQRPDRSTN